MKHIVYLIDLDGTVVVSGTQQLLPGAKERLDRLAAQPGAEIWFFSCWAFTPNDVAFLRKTFPYMRGYLQKPYAEHAYVFIDDKLDVSQCGTSL